MELLEYRLASGKKRIPQRGDIPERRYLARRDRRRCWRRAY
jgi:hypothetical protein